MRACYYKHAPQFKVSIEKFFFLPAFFCRK